MRNEAANLTPESTDYLAFILIALLSLHSSNATARDCGEILKHGIYNYSDTSTSIEANRTFQQWFCKIATSKKTESKSNNLNSGLSWVEYGSGNLGISSSSTEASEAYNKLCAQTTEVTSLSQTARTYLQEVSGAVTSAWSSCISTNRDNELSIGYQLLAKEGGFLLQTSYIPLLASVVPKYLPLIYQPINVECKKPDGTKLKAGGEIRIKSLDNYECERSDKDQAGRIVFNQVGNRSLSRPIQPVEVPAFPKSSQKFITVYEIACAVVQVDGKAVNGCDAQVLQSVFKDHTEFSLSPGRKLQAPLVGYTTDNVIFDDVMRARINLPQPLPISNNRCTVVPGAGNGALASHFEVSVTRISNTAMEIRSSATGLGLLHYQDPGSWSLGFKCMVEVPMWTN
jgi:hypothetical protein